MAPSGIAHATQICMAPIAAGFSNTTTAQMSAKTTGLCTVLCGNRSNWHKQSRLLQGYGPRHSPWQQSGLDVTTDQGGRQHRPLWMAWPVAIERGHRWWPRLRSSTGSSVVRGTTDINTGHHSCVKATDPDITALGGKQVTHVNEFLTAFIFFSYISLPAHELFCLSLSLQFPHHIFIHHNCAQAPELLVDLCQPQARVLTEL